MAIFKIEIPLSKFPLQELLKEISERKKDATPIERQTINQWLKKETGLKRMPVYGN